MQTEPARCAKAAAMPKTFPCADTTCRGRTLVDGTPCPDCQRKIDRENTPVYIPKHEGERHGGRASKFPQNGNKK